MATQPLAYRTTSPLTGVVERTFPSLSDGDLEETVAAVHAAYRDWTEHPIDSRAALARRISELLTERADVLAELAMTEMGKPLAEGQAEVALCAQIFDYYAENAASLLRDEQLSGSVAATAVIQSVPIGVLLGIMPWNFPYYQVARFFAPNLVLGNVVILKHAENVPQCAEAMEGVFADAGLPEHVYTNVFATHEQIEALICDARVAGVSLTGSQRAGSAVAAIAGRELKKCVLELGGSDPFVVLDDVDVERVAKVAWSYRLFNNGQACNSNKRIIVHEKVADEFVSLIVEKARQVDASSWRPMVSRAAAEQLAMTVEDAVAQGAVLHAGGALSHGPSAVYSPAVLTGVRPGMRAYTEELFGPVFVIHQVPDDDAAIALANDTPFGLGASVFGGDPERAGRIAAQIECGMATVNRPTASDRVDLPFGGVKGSGFGRELGRLGIEEFANKRLTYVAGRS